MISLGKHVVVDGAEASVFCVESGVFFEDIAYVLVDSCALFFFLILLQFLLATGIL